MRIYLFAFILLLLSSPISLAQTRYLTEEGNFACSLKSDYEKLMNYVIAEDKEAAMILINNSRCIILKGSVEVQLMDSTWLGPVQIRVIGTEVTVWTSREAIKEK